MAKLHVGQKLWWVASDQRRTPIVGSEVTVTKIGRKWAYLDCFQDRISIETLCADGGRYTSPGRCWLSRQEWEDWRSKCNLWEKFHRRIRDHNRVPDISSEAIREASKLLGITLDAKEQPHA